MLRAACVYTTPVGVVSHRSAAWLWGLTDRAPDDPELNVPALHHHGETTKGIVVHRSKDLDVTSHREWQTIRVTTPLRTLVDFAGCVTATSWPTQSIGLSPRAWCPFLACSGN
jgi:predicted transcriptional regulator of viral defense system